MWSTTMTFERYLGTCDASAAALIAGTSLFVAASDEDATLRIYDTAAPGLPVSEHAVAAFLEPVDPEEQEADIEGAAQVGSRIYWIGSHGRSKKGKARELRQRLFATDIVFANGRPALRNAGRPYKALIADLGMAPALAPFKLRDAAAAELSPEAAGGFNIEGLAPTPEGGLLIGFRNPLSEDAGEGIRHALVAHLHNPAAVVEHGTSPILTLAGRLDLGGRGIRALEFVAPLGLYLIVAGAIDDAGGFRLFRWSGTVGDAPRAVHVDLGDLRPEELVVTACVGREVSLHLLSDDGTDACKAAAPEQRGFRARPVTVTL
jgi:hypothetical protein